MKHVVLWVLVLVSAWMTCGRAAAEPEPIEALLQRQVEALRAGTPIVVAGRALASTAVLADLYERHGFRAEWTNPAAVEGLERAIRGSAEDGLDPEDYHLSVIAGPSATADLDLLRTDAFIRLAYHARFGKVDPERLDPNWNFAAPLTGVDPAAALQQAIDAAQVYEWIQSLFPQQPFYQHLREALAEYRRMAAAGGWPALAGGPTLTPGMTDPRVLALRRRLLVSGDIAPGAGDEASMVYDASLATGMRAFQERHGLPAEGVVGPASVRALNVPVGSRIEQLRATLERCRWVMHDVPERFVLVNIAGFMVYVVQDGAPIWESRVVVGTTSTRTPIFRAEMRYVVLNPTWTIPPGIMRAEIGPAMRRDPGYLARKGLTMVNGQVVQPPGPRNALGRIKLMFPNPHHVYLHDTPSKSFFNETSRSFSHGCVRVQKPVELAAQCLDDPAWTVDALQAAIATGTTRTVSLSKPIPVLILYWTAAVGRDGRTYFLPDVYGRDPAIIRGLAGEFRVRRILRNVGPT